MQRNALTEEQEEATGDVPDVFPPTLLRRYRLYFRPQRSDTPLAVRQIRGAQIGKLLTVRAMVTRISDVKPSIQVDAYACDVCGA